MYLKKILVFLPILFLLGLNISAKAESFDQTFVSAKLGDSRAQYSLSIMYAIGWGVDKSYSQAMTWLLKSAQQGNVHAQYYLGYIYENGINGMEQNYGESMKWYLQAAKQGWSPAQYKIGSMYYLGSGISQDYYQAMQWFRQAAEQEDAGANFYIGLMYEEGYGARQNNSIAKEYYGKACDYGKQDGCDKYKDLKMLGY